MVGYNTVLGPLMRAFDEGRTMLTPAMRTWVNKTDCPARDLTCFFEPLAPV